MDAVESRKRKTELQRKRREDLRAKGENPYSYKRLSEEEKSINKEIRKQKQREWLETEEGIAFKKRQSERHRKYNSVEERKLDESKRRVEKRKTNLDYNLKTRINQCKSRAAKEELPFDLDLEYVKSIYTDVCPYLGIKMKLVATSGNSMDAISIDKIIPALGYVKGNIQIISYKANVMKQDVDLNTLRTFAKSVLRIHGDE